MRYFSIYVLFIGSKIEEAKMIFVLFYVFTFCLCVCIIRFIILSCPFRLSINLLSHIIFNHIKEIRTSRKMLASSLYNFYILKNRNKFFRTSQYKFL